MLSSHARRILSGPHTKRFVLFFFSRFSGPKRDEERQTRATGKGQAHLLFFSRGTNFFHSKNLPSCWGLIFAIFRRSCPRNTSETTRRDVTVCKTRCRLTTIACFVWRHGRHCHAYSLFGVPSHLGQGISVAPEKKTRSDHVTRNAFSRVE